jgi:hypothetical protein
MAHVVFGVLLTAAWGKYFELAKGVGTLPL